MPNNEAKNSASSEDIRLQSRPFTATREDISPTRPPIVQHNEVVRKNNESEYSWRMKLRSRPFEKSSLDESVVSLFKTFRRLSLPPLVFYERHDKPDSSQTLEDLLPYLEAKGYRAFGFEFDENANLLTVIKRFEKELASSTKILQEAETGLKVDRDKTIALLNTEQIQRQAFENYSEFLQMSTRLPLLQKIRPSKLDYTGIDLTYDRDFSNQDPVTDEKMDEDRNNTIVSYILRLTMKYDGGVVFLIGAQHNRIQHLMRRYGLELLSQRMLSFHLHSLSNNLHDSFPLLAVDYCFQEMADADGSFEQQLKDAQESFLKEEFPIGINVIDCSKQDRLAIIKSAIESNIAQYRVCNNAQAITVFSSLFVSPEAKDDKNMPKPEPNNNLLRYKPIVI